MDKTIVYEGGNASGCSPLEAVALANGSANGVNAMLPAMMMGGCNGGGFGGYNSPLWAVIILAFLRNGGLWGNGDNNSQLSQIQDTLNTNQGNQLIMSAIQGNATSIKELASLIGCNQNALTTAINGVQSAICNVGNQVGMTSAQVVNAIQNGNMQLANTLQSCCCDIKTTVNTQGYENRLANLQQSQLIQNGFCQVGYEASQNANGIRQAISDQTIAINSKLDAMDKDRLQRENNALTAHVATLTARAERQAELAPIYKTLEEIKSKQPSTVSVPYPQLTAIPNYMLYGGAIAAGAAAGVFGIGGNTGSGIFG